MDRPDTTAPVAAAKGAPTFEDLVQRLEGIVGKLEGDEVPLESALALFEEGMALAQRGSQQLDDAERRLEVLLADGKVQPLDLDAE